MRKVAQANPKQPNLPSAIPMQTKQFPKHRENLRVQPRGLRQSFRPSVGVETRVANRQRQRLCRYPDSRSPLCKPSAKDGSASNRARHHHPCLRQTYDCAKSISAPHPSQIGKSLLPAPCGIARRPIAQRFFRVFSWDSAAICATVFNPHRTQGPLRHFPNPRNLPHRQRRQKSLFSARRNPGQSAPASLDPKLPWPLVA